MSYNYTTPLAPPLAAARCRSPRTTAPRRGGAPLLNSHFTRYVFLSVSGLFVWSVCVSGNLRRVGGFFCPQDSDEVAFRGVVFEVVDCA